ncbi:alpha/beta fold hydrolase [Thermoleophilia bacterium SCSIO 60948]|nr:alpha/beta fold hydrolase [Thermoleophilia bacterium SCSIO 60948]
MAGAGRALADPAAARPRDPVRRQLRRRGRARGAALRLTRWDSAASWCRDRNLARMTETGTAETETFERHDVEFESGGERCAAWLYLPGGNGPHPAIVLGHGLGATREMRLDAYAERFAAAGYACLVFDYRHFGDSGGEPRGLLSIRRELADWRAAIAYARTRRELDADRIVAWGSSFGGGHVFRIASEDDRLAAAIAQNPFADGIASLRVMSPKTLLKLQLPAIRDAVAAITGRPPVRVPTSGPPGSAALLTAPDSAPGVRRLIDATGHDADDEVAARFALVVAGYRPGRRASKIRCPILICACDRDTITPASAAIRLGSRAGRAQIRTYPVEHFDIYFDEAFESTIADQIAFLERVVPVR